MQPELTQIKFMQIFRPTTKIQTGFSRFDNQMQNLDKSHKKSKQMLNLVALKCNKMKLK